MAKTAAVVLTEVGLKLDGITPLLQHHGRLADPLNEYSKAISEVNSKIRSKSITVEEHAAQKARLQFLGGVYFDPEFGLYEPGYNVLRSIMEGGTIYRLKTKIGEAVLTYPDKVAIEPYTKKFDDAEEIYKAGHFLTTLVRIGTSRVMATRPLFSEWSISIEFTIDESLITADNFVMCAEAAGRFKGLGDGRLKGYGMGRFAVTRI